MYLHPDNAGSLGYEFEVAANGTRTNRHYLTAGGSVGVLITNGDYTSGSAQSVVKTEYWHKDDLGSIAATTDVYGGVTNRYAYDPFGKRRSTDGNYDGYGTIVADYPNQTDRGFTGHEQLDDIGIVHMNGRLYDANAGRFLQADPFIQAQGNLQSYNRYAYVMNNPLNATDPSGYFSWKKLFNAANSVAINPFDPRHINNFVAAMPGQAQADHFVLTHSWAYSVVNIAAAASTYYCGGCGAVFVSSYYAYESTGSFNAGFKAAAITGGTLAATTAIGAEFKINPNTLDGLAANSAAHAALGCASSAAAGGSCTSGAFAGGLSAYAAPYLGNNFAYGAALSAVIGGTASAIGGGKFSNGAIFGAFGYIFNFCAHSTVKCALEWGINGAKVVGGAVQTAAGVSLCSTGLLCLAGAPTALIGASQVIDGITYFRYENVDGFSPVQSFSQWASVSLGGTETMGASAYHFGEVLIGFAVLTAPVNATTGWTSMGTRNPMTTSYGNISYESTKFGEAGRAALTINIGSGAVKTYNGLQPEPR